MLVRGLFHGAKRLAALLLGAMLLAGPATADDVQSPGKGSPVRAAILDGVRPMVEAEVGKPVEFVVDTIRVVGEWAFVIVAPQRPGGGRIEYAYTRYQGASDAGAFDNQVIALLRDTPAGWLVYEYSLGATDVVWLQWKDMYPAPPEVYPGP